MSILDWGGIAILGLVALLTGLLLLDRYSKRMKLLDDKPERPQDHDWFFRALLEDADVQEMRAKRRGREGK